MADDDHEHPDAGLKPSASRLVASALGLVRARIELAGVELAEERDRLKWIIVLAVGGAMLAALAIAAASLFVVAYYWDSYRFQAIAAVAAIYAVLASLAFMRAASIVRRAPTPFSATIAEFEKDRARLAGGPLPSREP